MYSRPQITAIRKKRSLLTNSLGILVYHFIVRYVMLRLDVGIYIVHINNLLYKNLYILIF